MRWRIAVRKVIDRLHDTLSKELGPQTIHRHLCKPWIRACCHPVGQNFAGLSVINPFWFDAGQKFCGDDISGRRHSNGMGRIVFAHVHHRGILGVGIVGLLKSGIKRGHVPELVTLPFVERMIVALSTIERTPRKARDVPVARFSGCNWRTIKKHWVNSPTAAGRVDCFQSQSAL